MKAFMALLRLQLLSRFADLKPANLLAKWKEKKIKGIGILLAFVVLIAYLAVILYIVETKMLDVLMKMGMPDMLISMATMLATAGTLIMSFFFTLSTLYLGRDAVHLAALPLKSRTIMSAKLVQVWISETLIDAILLLPACILFGTRTGADAGFYLRMVVVWLLIAILPICIISFFSSLLIRLSGLWKHRELVVTVAGLVLMVAYIFLMMNLGGITGDSAEGGELMQKFVTDNTTRIRSMAGLFPPAAWAAEGMLGQNYGKFILWIAISLAAPVITVWLLGYSYRKLSLLQAETPNTAKKRTGKESFATGSAFKACVLREIRTILRVPSYATNILPIAFMPLLMIIMFFVMGNRMSDSGQSLQVLFDTLNPALVMVIMAAAMAYMAGLNPCLATAVSREGKGHDMMISLPIPTRTIIGAKFAVGFGLGIIGVVAASVALMVIFPKMILQTVLALTLCILYTFISSTIALCRDIRKPKLVWVTEQEAVKQNYGQLFSMLISWGILAALALLTYFLIRWGLSMVQVFLALACVLAVLCVVMYFRLNRVTDKYYCAQ